MRGYIEIEGYKEQNRVREGTEGGGQERQGTVRIGQRGGEQKGYKKNVVTKEERRRRGQGYSEVEWQEGT